jgi:hypothetical protein
MGCRPVCENIVRGLTGTKVDSTLEPNLGLEKLINLNILAPLLLIYIN